MKKIILSILCLILSLSLTIGCSNTTAKPETPELHERAVVLDELGLTYITPDSWREFEETRIAPATVRGDHTFAEIVYLYLTDEALSLLEQGSATLTSVGSIICEIVVAETSTFDEGLNDELLDYFEKAEKIGEQGDYSYYLLSGSKNALSVLTGEDLDNYTKLYEACAELKENITTREFDPEVFEMKVSFFENYLTFATETLEGIPVDSTIFRECDITIVNFNATYAYSNVEEFETLNSLYFYARNIAGYDVNLIHVVFDSNDEKALANALNMKEKHDVNFLVIKSDEILSSWLSNNAANFPVTVFVDSNGQIVGDHLEGAKEYSEYVDTLHGALNTIKERAE